MSGPYQVVSYEPGLQIDDPGWVVLNGEEVPIAITETEAIADMLQDQLQALALADEVTSEEDKEDCEASVRLMSAAPYMLKALDSILDLTPDYTDPESYVRVVRLLAVSAVTQATVGETDAGNGQAAAVTEGTCENCQQAFPLSELTLTVDPSLEDLTGDEEEHYYCKSCMEEMPKEL